MAKHIGYLLRRFASLLLDLSYRFTPPEPVDYFRTSDIVRNEETGELLRVVAIHGDVAEFDNGDRIDMRG